MSEKPTNDQEAQRWFTALAKGDAAVFDLCWSTYLFSQMLDDLVDRDKPVTHEAISAALVAFLGTVCLNPFFNTHRAILWGGLTTATMRWLAADEWRHSSDETKRTLAPAVAGGDMDFWLLVARIHGGFTHERAMKDFRHFEVS